MFSRKPKKNLIPPVNGDQSGQCSSSNKRVAVSEATDGRTSTEDCTGKTSWWNRFFGQPLLQGKGGSPSKNVKAPPPEKEKKQTKKTFRRLFNCCKRKHRVAPVPGVEAQQKVPEKNNSCTKKRHVHDRPVVNPQKLRKLQVCQLGLPNPAQICYMNSSLQSLLTLAEFVRDVSCQEDVWSLIPEAELISHFMAIVRCRSSRNARHKCSVLQMFKMAVSVQAPEFVDNGQKDAHEFLTTVLGQMRSVAPRLQEVAALEGKRYICPVESNLVFKMQNTRTCKSCGSRSIREEEFTNLSLVLGDSVQQMLQEYQMETELEYYCECGGNTSSQQASFQTLPRVLMLHLKRFKYTQSLQIVKLQEPVDLLRELMVTSNQDNGCYSLVSVISHLGKKGNRGHYINEGLCPDNELNAKGDHWLHYNDPLVKETTGGAICKKRQKTAYILFYQRRM